jgi:hypothetical protein
MLTIIDQAFTTDKEEGDINSRRILQAAAHYDITDLRWLRVMAALAETFQVVISKSYIYLLWTRRLY